MHELALMECVVDTVIERIAERASAGAITGELAGPVEAAPERVAVVRLEIGELAAVDGDALRFCFGVCTRETILEGAALDIVTIPGRARCRTCGLEHAMRSLAAPCPCGGFDRELLAGDELRVKELEVV